MATKPTKPTAAKADKTETAKSGSKAAKPAAKTPAAKPAAKAAPAKAAAPKAPAATQKPIISKGAAASAKPAQAKPASIGAKKVKPPKDNAPRNYGTGRRKDAVARVWIKAGHGRIIVNDREVEKYFARPVLRMIINQPFLAVDRLGNFDVIATVKGGGLSGQAGAIRHGISRALDEVDPAFHTALRKGGFLTRDSRVVERKKYGKAKARRSFQFSKR